MDKFIMWLESDPNSNVPSGWACEADPPINPDRSKAIEFTLDDPGWQITLQVALAVLGTKFVRIERVEKPPATTLASVGPLLMAIPFI